MVLPSYKKIKTKMKLYIYQIASSNGAEAIDNVDEYEAGFDISRQSQRLLLHGNLLSQLLNNVVGRNHVPEAVLFEFEPRLDAK